MKQINQILIPAVFLLFAIACSQDEVILENKARKGKTGSVLKETKMKGQTTMGPSKPRVEIIPNANRDIKASREKVRRQKSIDFNNHVELVINKYKIETLENRELQEYVKSIFVLYNNSENMNFYEVPIDYQEKDYIRFQTEDFVKVQYTIEIEKQKFNKIQHDYTKHKDWYVYEIDGQPFLGTDGLIPTEEIKYMKVKYNNESVNFPIDSYFDLYEPNLCTRDTEEMETFCYVHPYLTKDGEYLFLLMEGSNGAGVYEVIWVFQNGQFVTRAINIPY